jgi:hypothetical protein
MSDLKSKERCTGATYPAVWRFIFSYQAQVRVPDGYMDSKFSHYEPAQDQYDVVAVTQELAKTAYDHKFGWRFKPGAENYDKHELISGPEFICYVDDFVRIGPA